jgi:hypothetical protein
VSVEALRWVRTVRAGRANGLLRALAELADRDGVCFPSHSYLADTCEISESTVRRMIRLLVSRNLVAAERRFHFDGSSTSNLYRLNMGDPVKLTGGVVKLTGRVVTDEHGECSSVTPPLVTGEHVTTTEPCSYPTPPPPPPPAYAAGAAARMKQVQRGGGRGLCFPRTVSEAERQALEQQVAGLNHDNAQQVLDELAGGMAVKQIHSPIRYCAALVERFRRGQFKPELCLKVAHRRAADQQREARELCRARDTEIARETRPHGLPEKVRAQVDRMRLGSTAVRTRDNSLSDESVGPPTTIQQD